MKHPRWLWWTSLLTALLAFGLGLYGYGDATSHCEAGCWWRDSSVDHFETLHATLQLYVSNLAGHDMHNWYIRSAALLAPLSLAFAAFYALRDAFKKIVIEARLWSTGADHLFIGTGERATSIALAKARHRHEGLRIAGLDLNEQTLFRERLERLRWHGSRTDALVLEGHAMARTALNRVNVRHAETIWITTGDDALNLSIARRIAEVVREQPRLPYRLRDLLSRGNTFADGRPGSGLPRLLVRVERTRLVRAERALHHVSGKFDIEYFNLGRLLARQLFMQHPPLIPPFVTSSDRSAPMLERGPHIALCGDGDHVETLALTAAIHWILDERMTHCVRITLIGRTARAMRKRLLAQHPALSRSLDESMTIAPEYRRFADIQVLQVEADELEPDDWINAQASASFDAVYIQGTSDLSTTRVALRIMALRGSCPIVPGVPVVALLQGDSPHAPSNNSGASAEHHRPLEALDLVCFDVYQRLFANDERTPGEATDREAMLLDDAYAWTRNRSTSTSTAVSPFRLKAAWPIGINDDFKWSSRFSAAHVDVKLMLLDKLRGGLDEDFIGVVIRRLAASADWEAQLIEQLDTLHGLKSSIEAHLDMLSRLEHRRFVAERMIEGWLPVDSANIGSKEQMSFLRLNATLVPYDLLTHAQREFDHVIVRSMPLIVLLRGLSRQTEEHRPTPGG